MSDISNLSDTIIPKSDQLNSEQLLGGPITIKVTDIRRGTEDQPVVISYENDAGRPYKPCKSMRKVLIFAWGDDGREWIGRSMTLFNDPAVVFGGVKVGGIRISHLSDIERDIALSLTTKKGKKEAFTIRKLAVTAQQSKPSAPSEAEIKQAKRDLMAIAKRGMDALKAAWGSCPVAIRKSISPDGSCPVALKTIAAAADDEAAAALIEPEPQPVQQQEAPAETEQSDNDMF